MLFLRLILCLFPLLATPLLALLIAEGYLGLRRGRERPAVAAAPGYYGLWRFLVFSAVFWRRRVPVGRGLLLATGAATGVMVAIYLLMLLLVSGVLGIKTGGPPQGGVFWARNPLPYGLAQCGAFHKVTLREE